MALSNAERQRRWRDRLKAAAAPQPAGPGPGVAFPDTLARCFRNGGYDDTRSAEQLVADTTQEIISVIRGNVGSINDLDLRPIVVALGGSEYLHAVEEWHKADLTWRRSRKRDKGPAPEAPPIPFSSR